MRDLEIPGRYPRDSFPPRDYHTLRYARKSLRLMAGLSQDLVYHMEATAAASLVTRGGSAGRDHLQNHWGHSNIKTTQIYARVA